MDAYIQVIREAFLFFPIIAALLARTPNEKVRSFQTSSISFHCNTPVAWTLDGEYGGNHEDSYVEILPQAVQMIRGRDTV